jgi:hypothetical protein
MASITGLGLANYRNFQKYFLAFSFIGGGISEENYSLIFCQFLFAIK